MTRRAAWGIVSASLLFGAPRGAAAVEPAESAAQRDARLRFEEGLARVKSGRFEDARVAFAQAFAVLRKPDILWNLALSEEKSGHLADALGHFKQFDREAPSEVDRSGVKKHIDQLWGQTAHIEVTTLPGAQVTVDNAAAGIAPLKEPLDVMPGHHLVEARNGGFFKSTEVDLAAGQKLEARLQETDSRVAAAPAPGATAPMGTSDGAPPPPPPPAPDRPVESPASSGPGVAKVVTVTAIGGTALLMGGLGVIYALRSQSDANDATALRNGQGDASCQGSDTPRCNSLRSAVSAQSTDTGWATGFYVAGGVLAAGAVATWFLWPRSQAPSAPATATFVPSAGPNGAGLTVVGSF